MQISRGLQWFHFQAELHPASELYLALIAVGGKAERAGSGVELVHCMRLNTYVFSNRVAVRGWLSSSPSPPLCIVELSSGLEV